MIQKKELQRFHLPILWFYVTLQCWHEPTTYKGNVRCRGQDEIHLELQSPHKQTNLRTDCCKVLRCTKHKHPHRPLCFHPALGVKAGVHCGEIHHSLHKEFDGSCSGYWMTWDGLQLEQLRQPFMFSLNLIHIQQQLQRHAVLLKKNIYSRKIF